MKLSENLPIGFFDSGLGGLSVLREAVAIMPGEDYIYFGDSKNAPYGTKSPEEIRVLSLNNAHMLYKQGIKALVVACNTATSAAITALRETYSDIPVIGIEPALKPAVSIGPHPKVVIMATPLTVKGRKFHELLGRYEDEADVTALACPGLMEFVEEGKLDGPDVEDYLKKLLLPVKDRKIDAIVLGCTHYPFLKRAIRGIVGPGIRILDGGEGTARQLKRRLKEAGLLKPVSAEDHAGRIEYLESMPEKIPLCRTLMELPFEHST